VSPFYYGSIQIKLSQNITGSCVADPDPVFFFTLGSGIRDEKKSRSHPGELRNTGSGMEKFGSGINIPDPQHHEGKTSDLKGVSGNILLCDGAEDFHPLGEHVPGDEVQGQHELRQGEVDLEDLLLHGHRALAVVWQQLHIY
jgi:hypothetical protein